MKSLLFLFALMAFVAIANARPMMFFADQTDAPFNISNSWSGIVVAFGTFKKGQNYHRLRIFGTNHINETLYDAWISYSNGTIIDHLAVNTNAADRYILGDVRIGYDAFAALLNEQLYVAVASSNHKTGAIKGYFRCRPHQGIAVLSAASVVGGSSSFAVGLGWASIEVATAHSLPQDVLAQDASIDANSAFYGRVLHNSTNTTVVSFNAPADESSTASALATAALTGVYGDARFANLTVDADFYSIDESLSYLEVTAGSGNIRGQLYPLLVPSRRHIPFGVDTVAGSTTLPGAGLSTLRWANQDGSERNPNSYISFNAQANPTNFTHISVVYFNAATNKKNFELVRALTVEMNGRISGSGTWLFEFFDSTSGEFVPAATWSTANNWTPAYIDNWAYDVSDYADYRQQLIMRVSVNSATTTTLSLDLFAIRTWTPSGNSNENFKATAKYLNTFPGKFVNGTTINV
jgi:hypothetical protein